MKGTKCNYRLWRTANYPGQTYRNTHTSHNGVNNYYRTYNPNFPPLESWIIVIIRTKSLFYFFFIFPFFFLPSPFRHTWRFPSLLVVTDTQVYDTELPMYVLEIINALLYYTYRYCRYSWCIICVCICAYVYMIEPNNRCLCAIKTIFYHVSIVRIILMIKNVVFAH